ncbi:hypothetical protein UFOVP30_17 [uncultured Caudovirales phage]|uniref:Uncharacterized protein n=1 Tax=uncultured Caudovirales phage TaxID=2100421 RepID=A0A6J5KMJ8_9CAUD|nr:hypothetical protein UFOVP30_17 [uncultured Caudovirales phage]
MDELTQENKDFLIKIGQVTPEAKASKPAAQKVEE